MPMPLIASRRFGPMFLCQALSAFNDNYYKNALTILVIYELAGSMGIDAGVLISGAAAAFILPFFLCSALAGQLADHYPKYQLVRVLKMTEMGLFICAAIALYSGSAWFMLGILFLLGLQAAFFGPTKYAILPELLQPKELLAGNGLVEAGTFLAILIGTLLGGLLILGENGKHIVAWSMLTMGAVGLWAAYRVPVTTQCNPAVLPQANILKSTFSMVCHARKDARIFHAILGISWFWALGATYLTQIPIFTKEVVGGNEEVVTFFTGLFSVGIALGSLACHRLLHGQVSFRFAPYALVFMALGGFDIWWLSEHLPAHDETLIGLATYLQTTAHIHLAVSLTLVSIAGGIFIVPLYTSLQAFSEIQYRARTIASNNVMNALFIATASLAASVLYGLQFEVREVLLIASLLNLPFVLMFYKDKKAETAAQ